MRLVADVVHMPYFMEQDEAGGWRGSAYLSLDTAAFGYGATEEDALADLREKLLLLIEVVGMPDQLTITVKDDRTQGSLPCTEA
jgi:hypothetical protein